MVTKCIGDGLKRRVHTSIIICDRYSQYTVLYPTHSRSKAQTTVLSRCGKPISTFQFSSFSAKRGINVIQCNAQWSQTRYTRGYKEYGNVYIPKLFCTADKLISIYVLISSISFSEPWRDSKLWRRINRRKRKSSLLVYCRPSYLHR